MLYDVFICHASEDKEPFVRALAEALRAKHVEVWYDDFSLKLGDSIRQSIDKGLRQSRFGVVVFSKAFFAKRWPQYELDGLVEREMKGGDRVLLPVWHAIDHDDVMKYMPSLAGRKAALSSAGIDKVVQDILDAAQPQGSPLVCARDMLLDWGITPPVITDEYWLDVVEASNRTPGYGPHIPEESIWGRWSFPLLDKGKTVAERGDLLAWTAMQLRWVAAAEQRPITPLTPPDQVHAFIHEHPGLLETCQDYPGLVVEYAPQLSIRGNEGGLNESLEQAYRKSCQAAERSRKAQPGYRSYRTVDRIGPLCDSQWSLRHPKFGNHEPRFVASAYFGGDIFGPTVSPYEDAEHAIWLLSSASNWLPRRIRDVLIEGLASHPAWVWKDSKHDPADKSRDGPAFPAALYAAVEGKKFRWSFELHEDVRKRIEYAKAQLRLPENVDELMRAFKNFDFPNRYVAAQKAIRRAQKERARRPAPKQAAGGARKQTATRRRR
jgi:hypothetical protein